MAGLTKTKVKDFPSQGICRASDNREHWEGIELDSKDTMSKFSTKYLYMPQNINYYEWKYFTLACN